MNHAEYRQLRREFNSIKRQVFSLKAITYVLNMPALVALVLICAVMIRFDHGGSAKALFWGYFGAVLFAVLANYRWKFLTATEFYAMGLALICCFAAVKVVELASADHIARLRAENPTIEQMAGAESWCPEYLSWSKRDQRDGAEFWGFCEYYKYEGYREKWRELSKDYRAAAAERAAKIDIEPTASTTETPSGLWK